MPSRSSAEKPSATIERCTRSPVPSSNAAVKHICRSRSASMPRLQYSVCLVCLSGKHRQRRNVRVPLDESRNMAEPVDSSGIELPHGVAHRRVVRVDENLAALKGASTVTGEMHFL